MLHLQIERLISKKDCNESLKSRIELKTSKFCFSGISKQHTTFFKSILAFLNALSTYFHSRHQALGVRALKHLPNNLSYKSDVRFINAFKNISLQVGRQICKEIFIHKSDGFTNRMKHINCVFLKHN